MKKYKALLVDDESLARQIVSKYLQDFPEIEVVHECSDGFECLKYVSENSVDILFLDIQMPKLSGFEVIEVLPYKPEVIFTTAFDQYALKAFEINAVDYLLKPFSKDRFAQALQKCLERLNTTKPESTPKNYENLPNHNSKNVQQIVVRTGSKVAVIQIDDIYFIESNENYVNIFTQNQVFVKEKTMKYFEENLPSDKFIRLHRGYIANLNQIASIEPYTKDSYTATMKNNKKIKVSQDGYKKFRQDTFR